MKSLLRTLLLLGAIFSPLAVLPAKAEPIAFVQASQDNEAPVIGAKYFTRYTFFHERGTYLTTGYTRGICVPINSEVTLLGTEGKHFSVRIESTGETVTIDNVEAHTRKSDAVIAKYLLGRRPVDLDGMSEEIVVAIKCGELLKGMTKDQVLMARGFPPAHKTPVLEGNRWIYWSSRFVTHTLEFSQGVLTAGRGVR